MERKTIKQSKEILIPSQFGLKDCVSEKMNIGLLYEDNIFINQINFEHKFECKINFHNFRSLKAIMD